METFFGETFPRRHDFVCKSYQKLIVFADVETFSGLEFGSKNVSTLAILAGPGTPAFPQSARRGNVSKSWRRGNVYDVGENVSTSAGFPGVAFRADQKRSHVEQKRPTWKHFWENLPTWKRFPVGVLVKRFRVRHHVRPPEYPENRATWKRLSATENVSTSAVFLCRAQCA